MTFSIDNPEGGCNNPFGKYVWEKPLGEQGSWFVKISRKVSRKPPRVLAVKT